MCILACSCKASVNDVLLNAGMYPKPSSFTRFISERALRICPTGYCAPSCFCMTLSISSAMKQMKKCALMRCGLRTYTGRMSRSDFSIRKHSSISQRHEFTRIIAHGSSSRLVARALKPSKRSSRSIRSSSMTADVIGSRGFPCSSKYLSFRNLRQSLGDLGRFASPLIIFVTARCICCARSRL